MKGRTFLSRSSKHNFHELHAFRPNIALFLPKIDNIMILIFRRKAMKAVSQHLTNSRSQSIPLLLLLLLHHFPPFL
jgi:hypothetical protein